MRKIEEKRGSKFGSKRGGKKCVKNEVKNRVENLSDENEFLKIKKRGEKNENIDALKISISK